MHESPDLSSPSSTRFTSSLPFPFIIHKLLHIITALNFLSFDFYVKRFVDSRSWKKLMFLSSSYALSPSRS